MNSSEIRICPNTFDNLNDRKWLKVLLKSVLQNKIENVEMPGFPDDQTQSLFTSLSGEKAIEESFDFFAIVKNQCKKLNLSLDKNLDFLDFGSGWG